MCCQVIARGSKSRRRGEPDEGLGRRQIIGQVHHTAAVGAGARRALFMVDDPGSLLSRAGLSTSLPAWAATCIKALTGVVMIRVEEA
jgi:hypothetical protein